MEMITYKGREMSLVLGRVLDIVEIDGNKVPVVYSDHAPKEHDSWAISCCQANWLGEEGDYDNIQTVIWVDVYWLAMPDPCREFLIQHEIGHIKAGDHLISKEVYEMKYLKQRREGELSDIEINADAYACNHCTKEQRMSFVSTLIALKRAVELVGDEAMKMASKEWDQRIISVRDGMTKEDEKVIEREAEELFNKLTKAA